MVRILTRSLQSHPRLQVDAELRAQVEGRLTASHRRLTSRVKDRDEMLSHLREARRMGGVPLLKYWKTLLEAYLWPHRNAACAGSTTDPTLAEQTPQAA